MAICNFKKWDIDIKFLCYSFTKVQTVKFESWIQRFLFTFYSLFFLKQSEYKKPFEQITKVINKEIIKELIADKMFG